MSRLIENYVQPILADGIVTAKPISTTSTLAVTGAATLLSTLAVTGAATFSSTVATGAQTITGANSATGTVSAKTGTAVPATAGAVAAGVPISLNSNGITIEATTDVPTHNRPIGSICINLGGTTTNNRIYVATSAAGAWTAITTAA